MKQLVITAAALLSLGLTASADVVLLRDGRRLEGAVSQDGDDIVVRLKLGETRVKKSDVLKIVDTLDARDEYAALAKKLAGGTADERYRLGVFARKKGLEPEARKAFLSVLRVDIDHPGARAALGYVLDKGRWITLEDRNRLRGLVKHKGKWVTPAAKAKQVQKDKELAAAKRKLKAEAKARQAAEKKLAKQKKRAARRERILKRDLAKARARARRAEAEAAEAENTLGSPSFNDRYRVFTGTPVVVGGRIYYYPYRLYTPGCGGPSITPYPRRRGVYRYGRRYRGGLSGYYNGGNWGLRWRIGY